MTALVPAPPEAAGLDRRGLAGVDRLLEGAIARGRVAGAVALIARHGRVALHRAYGAADGEVGTPMRGDTIFRWYSMTKPIVSVGLLQLYEEGAFQLTDPLALHLPELAGLRVFAGLDGAGRALLDDPRRPPTVHDAFRHTAGFGSGAGSSHVDRLYRERGLTVSQLDSLGEAMRGLGELPLAHQPGERWVYGLAHDVQAHLIERLSGIPLDRYLRERIFEPLGMVDAGYRVPASSGWRVAAMHGAIGEPANLAVDMRPTTYERFADRPFGTLGLWGTAMDYARFAQALLAGGELNGARILSRKTVELMRRDHLPPAVGPLGDATPAPGAGYGLGVSVSLEPAAEGNLGTPGAFGWFGAATTAFLVDPAEDLVAVLMAQQAPPDGKLLAQFRTIAYRSLA